MKDKAEERLDWQIRISNARTEDEQTRLFGKAMDAAEARGRLEGLADGERARGMARLVLEVEETWERARHELDSVEALLSSMKSIGDAALASGNAPQAPTDSLLQVTPEDPTQETNQQRAGTPRTPDRGET